MKLTFLLQLGLALSIGTSAFAAPKVTLGVLGRLEAKAGKEKDLEGFLNTGLGIAKKEKDTVHWFGFKADASRFGIFDTFAADKGRDAHLNGEIPKALGKQGDALLASKPSIEKVSIIASNFNASKEKVTKGIVAILVAKPGKEADLKKFLEGGADIVKKEPKTLQWFAFQVSQDTFGIFDTFATDAGRDAHLGGEIPKALTAKSAELLAKDPVIEKIDIFAVK